MFRGFAHGVGDGIGLTSAHANAAAAIANHHSYTEVEPPAAFDHFGHTSDIHNTLVQFGR